MPTVYAYLCMPTSVPTCLYLPSVPPVYATVYAYLCNLGERSARSKAPPDSIDRLIVLIRIVLYGRSLAVHSNGGRLGCLGGLDSIRRRADIKALAQFDRSID